MSAGSIRGPLRQRGRMCWEVYAPEVSGPVGSIQHYAHQHVFLGLLQHPDRAHVERERPEEALKQEVAPPQELQLVALVLTEEHVVQPELLDLRASCRLLKRL